MLLEVSGLDVNAVDEEGDTALLHAAWNANAAIAVRALVAAPGVDINQANKKGDTALMIAEAQDNSAVKSVLLATPGIQEAYEEDVAALRERLRVRRQERERENEMWARARWGW